MIEATGSPEAIPLSFKLTSRFGRVVLVASTRGESKVNFYSLVHGKGILVIGAHESVRPKHDSFFGYWTQRDNHELVLLNRKWLKVKDIISLKLNSRKTSEAYRKVIEDKKDVLGVILDWM